MEEGDTESQPQLALPQAKPQLELGRKRSGVKVVLLASLGLLVAAGLVFAGYKFGQRQVQFQGSLAPTPTIISSRPSFPVDLGSESFILERIDEAPFVARIKVKDIFSSQPIPNAKVILQAHLGCPEVIGVKCEQPQFIQTTDSQGATPFMGQQLKELLEETSFSLTVEVNLYEKYSHEIPFGPTPIDVIVKLIGSPTARTTNSNQAFIVAESQSEVFRWLELHQKSPGFGKSAKFEKPFWIVEYEDKFTCPKGYDPTDLNCVMRVKVNAQTGEVAVLPAEEKGMIPGEGCVGEKCPQ